MSFGSALGGVRLGGGAPVRLALLRGWHGLSHYPASNRAVAPPLACHRVLLRSWAGPSLSCSPVIIPCWLPLPCPTGGLEQPGPSLLFEPEAALC